MKHIIFITLFFTGNLIAQNNKPVANPDSLTIRGDCCCPNYFSLLNNDIDTDGDILKVTSITYNGKKYSLIAGVRTLEPGVELQLAADGRGWIKTDKSIQFSYAISDGKRGTATSDMKVKHLLIPKHIIGINEITLYTTHEVVLYYDMNVLFHSGFRNVTNLGLLEITTRGVITLTPLIYTKGELNFEHEGKKIKIVVL